MARALRCVAKIRRGDDARDAGIPPVGAEASRLVRVLSTLIDDKNPQGQKMAKVGFWCWSAAALSAAACSVTPVRGRIGWCHQRRVLHRHRPGIRGGQIGQPDIHHQPWRHLLGALCLSDGSGGQGHLRLRRRARWSLELTRTGDRWAGSGIIGNRRVSIVLGH